MNLRLLSISLELRKKQVMKVDLFFKGLSLKPRPNNYKNYWNYNINWI